MQSTKKRLLTSIGLTVGIISGATAAYFLAPKRGIDTQKALVKNANKLTQKSIINLQQGLIKFELALANTERNDFNQKL